MLIKARQPYSVFPSKLVNTTFANFLLGSIFHYYQCYEALDSHVIFVETLRPGVFGCAN